MRIMSAPQKSSWSWRQAPELMDRLGKAQNREKYQHIDIMTFAGFCNSEEELRRHVERYEAR